VAHGKGSKLAHLRTRPRASRARVGESRLSAALIDSLRNQLTFTMARMKFDLAIKDTLIHVRTDSLKFLDKAKLEPSKATYSWSEQEMKSSIIPATMSLEFSRDSSATSIISRRPRATCALLRLHRSESRL
jgi:hypothetical protein